MPVKEIETPVGLARAHVERAKDARGSLVVSHGAGGGIDTGDLRALRRLIREGWTYVRVEQPWRVAGRRIAPAPKTLDAAWVPIIEQLLRGRWGLTTPLVVGGRSAGARVACRTAEQVGADGVLAMAFPLHPPGKPEKSRAAEATQVLEHGIPLAVVQGERDPFGDPQEVRDALGPRAHIFAAKGTHQFTGDPTDVLAEVSAWLNTIPG